VTSLQGSAPDASPNGVNTPHLDVELDTGTTGEWSPEFEARQLRELGEHGAEYGVLPSSILFDNDLSPTLRLTLAAMAAYSRDGRLAITQYRLAKRLGITRSSLSEMMLKAVSAGLLQRLEIDGEVIWRLRWLVFKRQAVPDAQRQAVPDSQAGPDVTRTRTHAGSKSSSLSTSPVRSSSKTLVVTDEERAWLHKRYDAKLGPVFVDEQIELCLGFKGTQKHSNMKLACNNWLIKACTDVANAKAAEARYVKAKTPYGAPLHDPKVSEPAPFLTHSVYDLPPFHDYTKD
jgi:hypothetical protein